MDININIIIYVIIHVLMVHLKYFVKEMSVMKIQKYVLKKFLKVIIWIIILIKLKNASKVVKIVLEKEMKQIIIVINVYLVMNFILAQLTLKIVIQNVNIIIILIN